MTANPLRLRISIPGIGGSLGECVICGDSFVTEVLLGLACETVTLADFSRDNDPESPRGVEIYLHERCLPALEAAREDWGLLPDGPLKGAYQARDLETIQDHIRKGGRL